MIQPDQPQIVHAPSTQLRPTTAELLELSDQSEPSRLTPNEAMEELGFAAIHFPAERAEDHALHPDKPVVGITTEEQNQRLGLIRQPLRK